ncbi:hypothetical protein AB4Z42_10940 [Mycobacterium sp. 2YAF39]|uniref:hypothetical protein n=1 Tax=Mycobacterium sp. 2YAF39 TaxID=3233033 RepID=UPI003F999433
MKTSQHCKRALAAALIAMGAGMGFVPAASADDSAVDPQLPGPVQVAPAPTSDNADPAAVAACSQFAKVLEGSSSYYGDFQDSFEGTNYADPAVSSSNELGRTALRESAALAMNAATTPGLGPDISQPMRVWSLGATKLLVRMGLHMSADSMNSTVTEMNNQATRAQEACASAGTHA